MKTLPFIIDDACAGLAHCHGLIRDEGKELVIEYQTQDAIAGIIKSDVQEARIPIDDIAGISLHRSWLGFSTRLAIQLVSMKHAPGLPGMKQGRFELPIARRDREAAEGLVASVSGYLSKTATDMQVVRRHNYLNNLWPPRTLKAAARTDSLNSTPESR